jgi:hypothetical protein
MKGNSDNDVQRFWKEQPRKEMAMTTNDIREKASRLEGTVWRGNAVAGVLFLVLFLKNAWEAWTSEEMLARIGHILIMAAFVHAASRYRHYGRQLPAPPVLGSMNCLDVYRAQLVRQRDMTSGGWRYFLPFAPGLLLIVFGSASESRTTSQILLLSFLGVALFVGCALVNVRSVRRLEREIRLLDALDG